MTAEIIKADAIEFLNAQEPDSLDLILGSPPYCDARTYGIDAVYSCQEWVDWMLRVTEAAVRVSKGLVLWVVSGVQRDLCYWPAPEGLAWEWWKKGNQLWRPCVWWKVDSEEGGTGIPGSGGKQWLRNDWEYVLAFKKEGWLPWADNTAMGHEPVYARIGGEMSNRTADGQRINEKAQAGEHEWNAGTNRRKNGKRRRRNDAYPSGSNGDGTRKGNINKQPPKIANPGNCIIVKARVGGGHMGGDAFCSRNEAPFPERLAEFFVLSFAPPGGWVADCFSGSGTVAAVCKANGRNFTGCDIRESQVALGLKRLSEVTPPLFT